jgi:Na+/H+-dicarboxylate symporter
MGLSTRIFIGLALGVLVGILLGELVSPLGVVGQAFVLLLQMTVLPYVAVSLVGALGSLRYELALTLARTAGSFLLLIWGITIAVVLLIPLAFPHWQSASFFSTTLVEEGPGFDFLGLFIPANPFRSLADSVVPAVVVFSIALGLALIGMENKAGLVNGLNTLAGALGRITNSVIELAPFGVFAIAANAAGTMNVAQLQGLQVYVVVSVALSLGLALWTLPALVTTLTDLRYGQVMLAIRSALVTAFATGNVFVVLPLLAERCKDLVQEVVGDAEGEEAAHLADVLITSSFNVPSTGKLLALGFVLFAGWLTGFAIPASQYASFVAAGLPSFFGSTVVAVPFMLDLFRIPADTFELFLVADNVAVSRFGAAVAAMFMVSLTLLSTLAAAGRIRIVPTRIARYSIVTIVLTLATILGVRFAYELIGRQYEGYALFVDRGLLEPGVAARVLEAPPEPRPLADPTRSVLDRISARGFVRAGFSSDQLPYAFYNSAGALVGFDVEMLHNMARDLAVELELVRVERDQIPALLREGYLDIATSRAITPQNLRQVSFPQPHVEETLAFIVPDHRRADFASRTAVKALSSPRLAVGNAPYYIDKLRRYLPTAELVTITSPRQFFRQQDGDFDALVLGAASGSAWSLVYPAYTVAVPHPDLLSVPFAYPLAFGETEMVKFVSSWIDLKRRDRTIEELFAYWMQGRLQARRKPRWSVVRDVLHWVE